MGKGNLHHFAIRLMWLSATLAALITLSGCASQRPVLYSRDGTPPGGDQAVSACMDQAQAAGIDYAKGHVGHRVAEDAAVGGAGGAVGGAIYGNAGRGAAAGAAGSATAGLLRGLFHSNRGPAPAYRTYVNRCLRDRGYDPVGWQ
jgi:hypothetical protein